MVWMGLAKTIAESSQKLEQAKETIESYKSHYGPLHNICDRCDKSYPEEDLTYRDTGDHIWLCKNCMMPPSNKEMK